MSNRNLVKAFVETAKDLGIKAEDIYVKSGVQAKDFGVTKFTSYNHTLIAMYMDDCENMVVLTEEGRVKQLITDEEIFNHLNCIDPTIENQIISEYGDNTLTAVVRGGKEVVKYVMVNSKTGARHSLIGNPEDTTKERLEAHWSGFTNDRGYVPAIRIVKLKDTKPFLPYFKNFTHLKKVIAQVKNYAQVKRENPVVRSRHTEILFMSNGNRTHEEEWNTGKKVDLMDIITETLKSYPEIDEVWVSGGYDGAESPVAMKYDDYWPQVHMWDVLLWKQEDDFAPFDWLRL